ncbi:calcium release-activated calcium channel protein 1 [Colletes latitarsis]|uniref:calcium release-activated calcium channel protein 1 n=1 Tax=Colletes latitarsis TaxID=2605962 RepID=UPI0040357073
MVQQVSRAVATTALQFESQFLTKNECSALTGTQRMALFCSPLLSTPALRATVPHHFFDRAQIHRREAEIDQDIDSIVSPRRSSRRYSTALDEMSSSSSAECSLHWERCSIGLDKCAGVSLVRNAQESSLMSIWSTSTGRNSVFGAEGGAVFPSTRLPIHVHVARTHLRNADGHCFHKRFHDCQSKMSQSGDGLHTPGYLSWRKLQLSRAKLKASSKTSALLSGFAMVAMVEVQLNSDTKVPSEMLIAFAVCTTLLVAVHMLALMISTCILPNIEAVCNLHSISLVHESPHERLHWYIEVAWAFSTLLGLLLFLFEIAILCWVKFYDFSQVAAWSACIVLIPVLIIFLAFAIHFYRSLVAHKYEVTVSGIRELELLKEQIESTDVEGRNGVNLLQTGVTHVV